MRMHAQQPKATRQPGKVTVPVQEKLEHRRTVSSILHLQRAIGNRAVQRMIPHGLIQRSALSEELSIIWMTQGREAFFTRLEALRVSEVDINDFVEQTLTGADLLRARRIIGTYVPLSDPMRNALLTQLVSRFSSAETFFAAACQQVGEDIRAEQAAQVDLVVALVSIGITYVVPGLGPAISNLVNRIPASSSVGVHAVALGIQSRAGAIASAIGDAGKRAAAPAARAALASSPRGFLNALIQGFAASKDAIVGYVRANILNRSALSDEDLWIYVSNWDPNQRTINGYAERIRDIYDRWRVQVQAIGPLREGRRSTLEQDRPYSTQVGVVWIRHSSGDVLVQAVVSNGRLSFSRFIDEDLKEMALSRAATQPRGVQTIPWGPPYIFEMPSSVPRNAARR